MWLYILTYRNNHSPGFPFPSLAESWTLREIPSQGLLGLSWQIECFPRSTWFNVFLWWHVSGLEMFFSFLIFSQYLENTTCLWHFSHLQANNCCSIPQSSIMFMIFYSARWWPSNTNNFFLSRWQYLFQVKLHSNVSFASLDRFALWHLYFILFL